jgi:hypothetical protein
MVPIVHRWVYGDFLPNFEVVDISSNLINGPTELVSKSDRKLCTSMRILGPLGRYEDRASQVFVKVGAADPAVRHLEPYFVSATCTKAMSAGLMRVQKED